MVTFDEQAHTYTSAKGDKYISATQLIGLFKEHFDAAAVAVNYAKKHGQTPEYWLEKWDETRNTACDRGHEFHKAKEDYINGRGLVIFKEQIQFVQNQNFHSHDNLACGLYTELLLWNEAYQLAGQSDIVVIRQPTAISRGSKLVADLDDHKTNKRIDETSYFNLKTKQHKMMKYPLNHLQDCNLQHYELQLSIYAWMLEQWGYEVGTLQITHYPHPEESIGVGGVVTVTQPKPVVYPLQYRKKEVLLMLNYHRMNKAS